MSGVLVCVDERGGVGRVRPYGEVLLRGFWIVFWVSLNVHNISMGYYTWAFFSAFMVSITWWSNAKAAAMKDLQLGAPIYGIGAGLGTLTGMYVGGWLG